MYHFDQHHVFFFADGPDDLKEGLLIRFRTLHVPAATHSPTMRQAEPKYVAITAGRHMTPTALYQRLLRLAAGS